MDLNIKIKDARYLAHKRLKYNDIYNASLAPPVYLAR
jgi:hypothetical protein